MTAVADAQQLEWVPCRGRHRIDQWDAGPRRVPYRRVERDDRSGERVGSRERRPTVADFDVSEGQRVAFDLAWHPSHFAFESTLDVEASLTRTEEW